MDRLADYEEVFNKVWLPRFGTFIAQLIYILVALGRTAGLIKMSVFYGIINSIEAIVDFIKRILKG